MSPPADPRVTPARPDLAARHLAGRVEAARFVDGAQRSVIIARAPLKGRPDADAPYASELLFGETFTVYDEKDGWAWGQLATDGYVGYVPAAALGSAATPTHWVSAPASHLYPEPDLKRPPLMPLYLGSRVDVAAEAPEKGFLPLATGGWIHGAHLRPLGSWNADFMAVAEQFIGAPYLWGGRTAAGLDCSGLVQMALGASGRATARDTDQQATSIGVAHDQAQPRARGDIVFFPGHVGLMVDSTHLLHANATHMAVTVNPLAQVIEIVARTETVPVSGVRRVGCPRPSL